MSEWEVVPDAPQAKAAPSSDWEVVPYAQTAPAAVPAEPQSFWRKAYHAAGAMTTNALDTATAGGTQFLRNLPQTARNIASGDAKKIIFGDPDAAPDPIAQEAESFNAKHPFAAGLSQAAGYAVPWGAPARAAQAVETAVRTGAETAPAAIRQALRPITHAITGGVTAGGTQLAEDVGNGAPLDKETLGRAAEAAGMGAVAGGVGSVAADAVGGVRDLVNAGRNAANNSLRKVGENAERRIEGRQFSDLGNKATKSQRDAIDALAPAVKDVLVENDLAPIAHDPVKLAAKSGEALKLSEQRLGAARREAGDADANVFARHLENELKQVEATSPEAAKVIQRKLYEIRGTRIPEPPKAPLDGKGLLAEMIQGGKAKNVERVGLKPDESLAVAKRFGLDQAAADPQQFAAKSREAMEQVGRKIGEVYEAAPGAPDPGKYVGDLERLAKSYQSNAEGAEAAAVRHRIEEFRQAFQNPEYRPPQPNPEYAQFREDYPKIAVNKIPVDVPEFLPAQGEEWKPMTTEQFHRYQSTLRGRGFSGAMLDPSASTKVARRIGATAASALESHLAASAAADPGFAGHHSRLAELNRDYAALKTFNDIAERRAAKANVMADEPVTPDKFPRNGKIPVIDLAQIAEEHQPFDVVRRQYSEAKTPTARAKLAIARAAQRTIDEAADTAGVDGRQLQDLARKTEALKVINQTATYKARALRYPVTGLRDIVDKSHRVLGSKILGRGIGAVEDKIIEKATRPLDERLSRLAHRPYAEAVNRLADVARRTEPAQFVAAAVRAGMPRAEAQKISDEAQRTRMAGNP